MKTVPIIRIIHETRRFGILGELKTLSLIFNSFFINSFLLTWLLRIQALSAHMGFPQSSRCNGEVMMPAVQILAARSDILAA